MELWNLMTNNNAYSSVGYFTEDRLKGLGKLMQAMGNFEKDPVIFEPIYNFTTHVCLIYYNLYNYFKFRLF